MLSDFRYFCCGFRGPGVCPLASPRNSIHFAPTNAPRALTAVRFRLATLSLQSVNNGRGLIFRADFENVNLKNQFSYNATYPNPYCGKTLSQCI